MRGYVSEIAAALVVVKPRAAMVATRSIVRGARVVMTTRMC